MCDSCNEGFEFVGAICTYVEPVVCMDYCDNCTSNFTCDVCSYRYEFNPEYSTCDYVLCYWWGNWDDAANACVCDSSTGTFYNESKPGCDCTDPAETLYYTDSLPESIRNSGGFELGNGTEY